MRRLAHIMSNLPQNIDPDLTDAARAMLNVPVSRPDSLLLAEYELGTLSAEDAAIVAAYLASLPADDPELVLFRRFQKALEPRFQSAPPQDRSSLRRLIARLLPKPPATAAPALAVRGSTAPKITQYVVEHVHLTLQSRPSHQHPHSWKITGMALGLADQIEQVRLFDAEAREVDVTTQLNEGNFSADNLPPGRYDIVLQTASTQVEIPDVTIG